MTPTLTSKAGLASEGMSSANVVRRVAAVNDEWCSAWTRRRCREVEGGESNEGRDSCASRMADNWVVFQQIPSST